MFNGNSQCKVFISNSLYIMSIKIDSQLIVDIVPIRVMSHLFTYLTYYSHDSESGDKVIKYIYSWYRFGWLIWMFPRNIRGLKGGGYLRGWKFHERDWLELLEGCEWSYGCEMFYLFCEHIWLYFLLYLLYIY
jgi:hypothetical protein